MKRYLVGGAVRDELLGWPTDESDWVVVGATAQELLDRGFRQVGKGFPVFLHPETGDEHALARTERKIRPGYHGFDLQADPQITIYQDLQRRDLTINAMARDEDGTLIDPYGGQRDIELRLLRHVSPAFVEDPVRVLRVARFASRYHPLGFRVAEKTLELMRTMVDSGEVDHLVPERVWAELARALAEPAPWCFVEVLRDCGALPRVFPEIAALFGVPQPQQHHPEIDCGVHLLLALQQVVRLDGGARVSLAVMLHDLGKATTPEDILPSHIGHEQRSVELVKSFCQRLRVPNAWRDLAVLVARFHTTCHRALELRPQTVLKMLEAIGAFKYPDRLEEFLLACEADARGRKGLEQRSYPQAELIRQASTAAAAVDSKPLREEGLYGAALGEAIRRERLSRIAMVCSHSHHGQKSSNNTPPNSNR